MLWQVSLICSLYLFFLLKISTGGDVNTLLGELDQSLAGTLAVRHAHLVRAVGVLVQVAGGN
jgi:hypothetical protein